jgi:hypothetical protein
MLEDGLRHGRRTAELRILSFSFPPQVRAQPLYFRLTLGRTLMEGARLTWPGNPY